MKTLLFIIFLFFNLNLTGVSDAFDLKPIKLYKKLEETPRGFTVAVELNSGFKDSKEIVNPVYIASIRVNPEISLAGNYLRIGMINGVGWENPGITYQLGLRLDYRIYKIKSGAIPLGEIRAGLSYYYTFKKNYNAVGFDVKIEVADLLYISLRVNKILKGSQYIFEPGLGLNI